MSEQKSYYDGNGLSLFGWTFLGGLICVCTLFICFPWAYCMVRKYTASHTVVEGRRLKFNGEGTSLFGNWFLWWFLSAITLGIYGFWVPGNVLRWVAKNTSFSN
ncbi:MAG: YjgN family protein [Chitinispirillia bacterium]|nr:YjgN family protein [Chitinispirillia bacterium]